MCFVSCHACIRKSVSAYEGVASCIDAFYGWQCLKDGVDKGLLDAMLSAVSPWDPKGNSRGRILC